ncbi:ATPase, T2SS/T4P/T4SS family [Halopenitus sp. H-Gu1]|uniref:ATPase, T2SS/T4P/T4SS family n=1 Tax=Halopenitus sp. H-Gu1 TaxID=3242697 RepID=UPI00359D7EBF
MAIEDVDGDVDPESDGSSPSPTSGRGDGTTAGEYTWEAFLREHGHEDAADRLRERPTADAEAPPSETDWDRVGIDPADFLGFDPEMLPDRIGVAASVGETVRVRCSDRYDLDRTPVKKDYYTWEEYKREYFYDAAGDPPTTADGEPETFDPSDDLGFDPTAIESVLAAAGETGSDLDEIVDERTVNVADDIDEDAFFSDPDGTTTLVNRYDLEKSVPNTKKSHFQELERYWVNEPYAFVIIFHSTKENERKYYAIQPYMTEIETELQSYLTGKLRTSIKYADESIAGGDEDFRREVIAEETYTLLDRYDLYSSESESGPLASVLDRFGFEPTDGIAARIAGALGYESASETVEYIEGLSARPESAVLDDDPETLTEYQVQKLLYFLQRDFIGYERIDPIKFDINVEDISCDGYNSPVFVYHSEYEQIISNIHHERTELDDFVVKLAQRSGKGISKRSPQVDCTLPDGSRAQLTLGKEVSDHGTNYTIRQFKDVPFTPVDLINWRTFSLDEMAFLWLCIENHKSLIFAGGTASGKTTSLNAVSLFIPSNSKIVSIEDTREVELPQRNWIASVTRPSFSDDDKGDVDEFDLLEAALRQRPDYIVMGEIRGEEGRTLFQVMSTGHTTYTTFHADSVGEVLKRFTTDPINVSKTMFTALDLVSIQTSTRVQGRKVRRNKSITEINHYDAENDEINVQDVYQWQAETDEFLQMGESNTLEEIKFDRGWTQETLSEEMFKRRIVLAYLIDHDLNTYAEVAATAQAFINDPETILALMANDDLKRSLEDLREMESVQINVEAETEAMVPRPDPDEEGKREAAAILEEAEDIFERYRDTVPDSVAEALVEVQPEADVEVKPDDDDDQDDRDTTTDADDLSAMTDADDLRSDVQSADPESEADDEPSATSDDSERADEFGSGTDESIAAADSTSDDSEESDDDLREPLDLSNPDASTGSDSTDASTDVGDDPPRSTGDETDRTESSGTADRTEVDSEPSIELDREEPDPAEPTSGDTDDGRAGVGDGTGVILGGEDSENAEDERSDRDDVADTGDRDDRGVDDEDDNDGAQGDRGPDDGDRNRDDDEDGGQGDRDVDDEDDNDGDQGDDDDTAEIDEWRFKTPEDNSD